MKICPKCGKQCEDNFLFCDSCGYSFGTANGTAGAESTESKEQASNPAQEINSNAEADSVPDSGSNANPAPGTFNNNSISQNPIQNPCNNVNQSPAQNPYNNINQNPIQNPYNNINQYSAQNPYTNNYNSGRAQGNVNNNYNVNQPNGPYNNYAQNPYQGNYVPNQNQYQTRTDYAVVQGPKNNPFAIASLVLGIIGVLFAACCYTGVIPAVLSIVFGCISRGKIKESFGTETGNGFALAGLILGIAALVIAVIYLIITIVTTASIIPNFDNFYDSNYNLYNT
ncbi:MAG TPA: DUF4190 domain-containing protein [Ruminiclostridium sp.]|nr:DUF4190 domain-containing protein [Ruminiclostridium sp.]